MSSDTVNFAAFMRLSAPARPAPLSRGRADRREPVHAASAAAAATRRRSRRRSRRSPGCRTRHTTRTPTSRSITWARAWPTGSRKAPPARTSSGPRRSGASGQRLFFLHDGRTSDLGQAIEAHASSGTSCVRHDGEQRGRHGAAIVQNGQHAIVRVGGQRRDPELQRAERLAADRRSSTSSGALSAGGRARRSARAAGLDPRRVVHPPREPWGTRSRSSSWLPPAGRADRRRSPSSAPRTRPSGARASRRSRVDGRAYRRRGARDRCGVERSRGGRGDVGRCGAPPGDAPRPPRREGAIDGPVAVGSGPSTPTPSAGERSASRSPRCFPSPSPRRPRRRGARPSGRDCRAPPTPRPAPEIAELAAPEAAPTMLRYALDVFGTGAVGLGGSAQTGGGGAALETFLAPRIGVFVHQRGGEARFEVVVGRRCRHRAGHRAVGVHRPAVSGRAGDHVEQRLRRQPELFGQHECFADCDLMHGQHHVVAHLGGLAGAARAAVNDFARHRLQHRTGQLQRLVFATDHERQRNQYFKKQPQFSLLCDPIVSYGRFRK